LLSLRVEVTSVRLCAKEEERKLSSLCWSLPKQTNEAKEKEEEEEKDTEKTRKHKTKKQRKTEKKKKKKVGL